MATKLGSKTITVRPRKTLAVATGITPKSKQLAEPDMEIEFDEDDDYDKEPLDEADSAYIDDDRTLDGYLLASRDATIDEAITSINNPNPSNSDDEDETNKISEIDDLDDVNDVNEVHDVNDLDDVNDVNDSGDAPFISRRPAKIQSKQATTPSLTTSPTEKPARKARKIVAKQKKTQPKALNVKRGPGRPPKTQKKDPIPRRGIAKNPHNPDSYVEVLYDQPVIMKKIFSFFKYVAAAEIQILFRPRDIIFYAIDHNGKTKIRVRINAEKLNHYYCRDVLDVGISQKEMEMILNKVDKDYSSIVILSDVSTTRRNLTLVFENDIQIDELHRIDLIASYAKMEDENMFVDEDYTIKFNFPSRYFKKTVGDIKSMSPQLSITQEDNESPLIFEYLTVNKRIQSKHTVKDSAKIKLESKLENGESFRVDVCIDYLKPISASQISDDITILVDENKCLMTKSYIDDGTIEIKTLTEIIDERPDDDDD